MRREAMAGALAAIVAALTLAGQVNADPRFHGGRVYVASDGCSGKRYRPTTIVLACADGGLLTTDIRYHFYGGATAVASAELRVHNCVPNCAESVSYREYSVTLTLADVVRCQGTLYYSRAHYRFVDGTPYGWVTTTADIEPSGEDGVPICSTVLG